MTGGVRKAWQWVLVAVSLLAASCNNIHARAKAPTANVVSQPTDKSVRYTVLDAPDGEVCSKHRDLKDFCIENLKPALSKGLKNVLSKFLIVRKSGTPDYSAELRFLEFRHSPDGGDLMFPQIKVSMRWQLVLKDSAGKVRLELAENTVGGEKLTTTYAANDVTRALLTAVMDRIGKGLAEARLGDDVESDDEAAESAEENPKPVCVPGSTQACLGPGACQGAQACLPDGAGYGACDCGTPVPAQ